MNEPQYHEAAETAQTTSVSAVDLPRLVGPDWKPPIGGMGGSVHDWERGSSPWHRSAFPSDLADQAPEQGSLSAGWYALDWCGNQIGFVADGTPWPND